MRRVQLTLLTIALLLLSQAVAFGYPWAGNGALAPPGGRDGCREPACHGLAYGAAGPHAGYSGGTKLCRICHTTTHDTIGDNLLYQDTSTKVCLSCHDGTGAPTTYRLGFSGVGAVSSHSIEGTSIIPGGAPSGGDATGAFSGTDGKLTCLDCHSPHGQNTVQPFLHWRSRAGEALGQPFTSSSNLRRSPAGSAVAVDEYGSDWCLACHRGRPSGGMVNNHPVDSLATTDTPFTYADVIVGGGVAPTPVALSADGAYVYVADVGNHRIVQYNTATGAFVRSWTTNYPAGQLVGLTLVANLGGTAARDLMSVDMLDPSSANSVQEWQTDGTLIRGASFAGGSQGVGANRSGSRVAFPDWGGMLKLYMPWNPWYTFQDANPVDSEGKRFGIAYGVTVDSAGVIYVADYENSRIAIVPDAVIEHENWHITGYIPAGPLPVEGSAPGQFSRPLAIAIGPTDLLYVADTGNNRVQVLTTGGAVVDEFGGTESGAGALDRPGGIAVADDGTVYVADSGNHRIVVFNSAGGYVRSIGSPGTGPGQLALELSASASLSGSQMDPTTYNSTHLMADPRLLEQEGHGPICQQCHDDARDPGTLVDGLPAPSSNLRERGWFPHESPNPAFLIEEPDGLCLNCHTPPQQ